MIFFALIFVHQQKNFFSGGANSKIAFIFGLFEINQNKLLMKKTLLLGCAVGLGLAASAQSNGQGALSRPSSAASAANDQSMVTNVPSRGLKTITPVAKTNAVTIKNLGTSRNAYSNAFGVRQMIVASNATNSVALVRRASSPATSGTVRMDVSTDGGNTWNVNNVTVWNNTAATNAARYPRAAMINPPGNTNGANTVLIASQPLLDGTNGSWGGLGLSATTFGGTSLGSRAFASSATRDTMHQIPSSVVAAGSKIFILDQNGDISLDYSDTLLLTTGTFAGTSVSWTRNFINFATGTGSSGKAGIADMTMAFDNSGQIGYIVALTHINFTTDTAESYLPVIMKTTNGGATWSAPVQLSISSAVNTALGLSTPITATTGFEVSATVDNAGNCHIVCHVGRQSGSYSVVSAPGESGTFHFKTDGATLLATRAIGAPGSLRGTFGIGTTTLSQDTRPCASRNEAGNKLFFSWYETDTTNSGSNDQADLMTVGYDVTANRYTQSFNLTKNTLAEGAMIFGSVAPIVFERPGAGGSTDYELAASYVELNTNGDVADSCYHRFIKGAVINSASFVGASDLNASNLNVSKVYPNPSNGVANFEISLDRASDVKVSVTNMVGQVVNTKNFNKMTGRNIINLDVNFPSGIYFINVEAAGKKVSQKLIVE